MPQAHCWARVRARTNAPLRRGAWYRVVRLEGRDVVLEVNRRFLKVSRGMLQVLPIRPPMWSVVPRPLNDCLAPGDRYGVCPNCCDRVRLEADARVMRCPRCRSTFAIVWSDAAWRALEVPTGTPDKGALAKARAAALAALATALRLGE